MNNNQYTALYQHSIQAPMAFWATQARECITWIEPWQHVMEGTFQKGDIRWFVEGRLNACYNCIDRHLPTQRDKVALLWQGNNPNDIKSISYGDLHFLICKFANVLTECGIKKGDRVCIYLPMIPEVAIAMLACARIGAIHSVVFSGFSAESLEARILDADCSLLITADEGLRGEKIIPLKINSDEAIAACPNVKKIIVIKRTGNTVPWNPAKDAWYHDLMENANADCPIEIMDSSDPLFILYTSGSTGKPKGIVHSTGGYMVYVASTFKHVFTINPQDIYWCTADVGWITGHSYGIYGPLANATTTVMYEGIPHYPSVARCWEIIDTYKVSIFYTSPTLIRSLRKEGESWLGKSTRKSLRLLGTVGEPINPEVWQWYYTQVGMQKCPIVDTWWQTETGGILIAPLTAQVNHKAMKAGAASTPCFGIVAEVVDDQGQSLGCNQPGQLVIKHPWPGLMLTIYGDHKRFLDNYFQPVAGCYFTGDGAYRDEDGDFWITGRNDDVIKVSGHRFGTEEIESALLKHPSVSEAAVVGIPDEITGEAIFAFVSTLSGCKTSDTLKDALMAEVIKHIGAIAKIKQIQWVNALPKTRSGKIMRRILRKIASHDMDNLGDLSTLIDPGVVTELIDGYAGNKNIN